MGLGFWKTRIGKILSHGIHEHGSGLGYIANNTQIIKTLIEQERIKFKDKESEELFNVSLERISRGRGKCRESIDYIYEKIKEETWENQQEH